MGDGYTPGPNEARHHYATAVLAAGRVQTYAEAYAEHDRFLATVRRDARREALSALAAQEEHHRALHRIPAERRDEIHALIADAAATFRDRTYPKAGTDV